MQGSDARDALLRRIFGLQGSVPGRAGGSYTAAARLAGALLGAMRQNVFLPEAAAASALLTRLDGCPTPVLARLLVEHEGLRALLMALPSESGFEVRAAI